MSAIKEVPPSSDPCLPARRAKAWLDNRLERGRTERFIETVPSLGPAMAAVLYAINIPNNRRQSPDKQARFVRIMEEGRWRLVQQGMSVTKGGKLIDGQNRLQAIIKSGVSVPMHIEFGCEEEEADVIDTGSNRTAGDVAKMAGLNHETMRCALARLDHMLRTRDFSHIDAQKVKMIAANMDSPALLEAIHAGQRLRKASLGGFPPGGAALAYLRISTKSRFASRLPEFWNSLCDNEPKAEGPILNVRDSGLAKKITTVKTARERAIKNAAAIILGWDAWVLNRKQVSIDWKKVVELPEVV